MQGFRALQNNLRQACKFVKLTKIGTMSKKHELQAYKESLFKEYIQRLVEEKREKLGEDASKKKIAISIANDLGFEDYMGLYKVIYSLDKE